jgi:hypothetical protein
MISRSTTSVWPMIDSCMRVRRLWICANATGTSTATPGFGSNGRTKREKLSAPVAADDAWQFQGTP